MIPLAIFLGIWLILVLINGILTMITLGQFFKHATPSPFAYGYAVIFIGVMMFAVLGCGSYFLNVNWEEGVSIIPPSLQTFITGSSMPQDTLLEQ